MARPVKNLAGLERLDNRVITHRANEHGIYSTQSGLFSENQLLLLAEGFYQR
jgi:hypothetical protein